MERVSPATAAGQAARQAALARLSQACVCEEEEGRRSRRWGQAGMTSSPGTKRAAQSRHRERGRVAGGQSEGSAKFNIGAQEIHCLTFVT